jgi:hypothetical protein
MKKNLPLTSTIAICILLATSCSKPYSSSNGNYPPGSRTIRFQLYTNQDFSNNNSVIHFSIFIKNGSTKILDSSLATLLIKDIPDSAHKIVIEKTVTGYNNADLSAGFQYEIENVGFSWFIDTSKAGNTFKVIDYAFQ